MIETPLPLAAELGAMLPAPEPAPLLEQKAMLRVVEVQWHCVRDNVGVLYQTMYLVATAMGLAPCALSGGSSDLFAAAAGTDYLAESSVGECLLGSLAHARAGHSTIFG